jgi:ketol-acid reductoisomerase
MAIINKPRRILAKVAKFVILVKEKLLMRRKNMARYHPNNSNNDEYKDIDDENEHYEKKTKKKSKKVNIDIIKEGVYCQNCFNESHFTKECKLLMKLCRIYKANDHNMDQCPSKVVNGSCPSREIVLVHVIQVEIPIVQE